MRGHGVGLCAAILAAAVLLCGKPAAAQVTCVDQAVGVFLVDLQNDNGAGLLKPGAFFCLYRFALGAQAIADAGKGNSAAFQFTSIAGALLQFSGNYGPFSLPLSGPSPFPGPQEGGPVLADCYILGVSPAGQPCAGLLASKCDAWEAVREATAQQLAYDLLIAAAFAQAGLTTCH